MTPREAAAALRISERTLWSLTKKGAIPSAKIGRAVRYDVRDLLLFLDRMKTGNQPADGGAVQ
jgi:excisionase family DNA binding protein